MNYYQWLGQLATVSFPDDDFNGWWMVEGTEVHGWDERLIAVYPAEDPPTFDFTEAMNGWPVFSRELRDFLTGKARGVLQFLPFRLQREDGTGEVLGFSVGQVLRVIECLDRSRTKVANAWQPINPLGDYGTRGPLVLNRRLIGDQRIFRIKGDCLHIVIREDLRDGIDAAGFTGHRFDLLEATH